MKERIISLTKYPLIMITTLIIATFFVGYLACPQKEKSEWENRYLGQRPEIKLQNLVDGSFMKDFENYTNDQILFRDGFIKIKAVSEGTLFRNVNNGIVRANDGQLFTEDLSNGSVFKKNGEAIIKFIKDTDRNVKVAIAPNASCILKDGVPTGMPVINQGELIDGLNSKISLLDNAYVVDLRKALMGHEDEYIYYRTDHHWTTLGAYLAYEAISEKPVSIDTLKLNEISDFYGTLYAKYKGINVEGDTIQYADIDIESALFGDVETNTLYDLSKADVFDKYATFLYGNFGFSEINTKTESDRTLLIFKDSYANCLIPFLTFDYGNIKIVDLRYYGDSVKDLLKKDSSADILLLYNFDFMNEDNHFYKLLK